MDKRLTKPSFLLQQFINLSFYIVTILFVMRHGYGLVDRVHLMHVGAHPLDPTAERSHERKDARQVLIQVVGRPIITFGQVSCNNADDEPADGKEDTAEVNSSHSSHFCIYKSMLSFDC